MVKDVQFISIKEIVSRLLRHPLLQDFNLESAIQYTIDFLHIMGMEDMFVEKEEVVEIKDYRGKLPCDLLQVTAVKNNHTGLSMRSTTNDFKPDGVYDDRHSLGYYTYGEDATYKTQNQIIFTSFKDGWITVAYRAIAVDDEGYPLVIDNANFLKALELYMKCEQFTILFDQGKIDWRVMEHTEREYAWAVGRCESEFSTPSMAEMESISNSWNTLIQKTTEFDHGFKNLGNREYIRRH